MNPKRIGRSWLDDNRLLLLLDGLDEVQQDRRRACMVAINTFMEEYLTPGVVVCCRLEEYSAAPVRLKMNGAVCLQPLSPSQIEAHLARLGVQADALREALRKDTILQDLARSPLMLSVMMLTYQGSPIETLLNKATTPEARRTQIFDTYIDRMFQRKKISSDDKNKAITYLSWIATNLSRHGQTGGFLVQQLQPSWLKGGGELFTYLIASRFLVSLVVVAGFILIFHNPERVTLSLISALVISILGAVGSAIVDRLRYSPSDSADRSEILHFPPIIVVILHWLMWVVVISNIISFDVAWFSASGGLIVGSLYANRTKFDEIQVVQTLGWSWQRAWAGAKKASKGGLILLIVLPLIAHPDVSLEMISNLDFERLYNFYSRSHLMMGIKLLIVCPLVIFFVVGGLVKSMAAPETSTRVVSSSIKSAAYGGLAISCVSGLLLFVLENRVDNTHIYFAIYWGFVGALSYGGLGVIQHHILLLVMRFKRYVPGNYISFLDHCAKLIFLRKVGTGYIFIHRMLLEHMASMWQDERVNIDRKLVYPANPPKTPHVCWLNLVFCGLGQMILGQVSKGIAMFAMTAVALIAAIILTGGISYLAVVGASMMDAFMVGKALRSGRPVGKWEFFPSVNRHAKLTRYSG